MKKLFLFFTAIMALWGCSTKKDYVEVFNDPMLFRKTVKDSTSYFYKQVMLIKRAIDNLSPEQKHIADFWDDNSFTLNVSGHVMLAVKSFRRRAIG